MESIFAGVLFVGLVLWYWLKEISQKLNASDNQEIKEIILELVDIIEDTAARKQIDSFTAQPARLYAEKMGWFTDEEQLETD